MFKTAMRKFLFIIVAITFINTLNMKSSNAQNVNGKFVHTVFFWLKNPDSKEDQIKFETSLKKFLKSSAYIKSMHVGIPASTNRPIIDTSYSYCLNLTFNSKEDHDKYQEEEVHKVFIKESESLWKKVLIYDSENIL